MESATLANALVGNQTLLPCIELPLSGGVFEFTDETNAAIVGAKCILDLDGRPVQSNCRIPLPMGSVLEVGPSLEGARVYLAVEGGFEQSARACAATSGTLLFCRSAKCKAATRLADAPRSARERRIRFLSGPQANLSDLGVFSETKFKVSNQSDRRGVRLESSFPGCTEELPSEPSCVGAIQITPSGMPIVLGVDGPTIGGYPKIGCVIGADLSILGQLRVGDAVSFEGIGLREAQEANVAEGARIAKLVGRLVLGYR